MDNKQKIFLVTEQDFCTEDGFEYGFGIDARDCRVFSNLDDAITRVIERSCVGIHSWDNKKRIASDILAAWHESDMNWVCYRTEGDNGSATIFQIVQQNINMD